MGQANIAANNTRVRARGGGQQRKLLVVILLIGAHRGNGQRITGWPVESEQPTGADQQRVGD
jgi:hypothetical protein